MPETRFAPAVAIVDGMIYVVGGHGGPKMVEAYDPATDNWTERASVPNSRLWSRASVVDGKIYVVGGAKAVGAESYTLVEEYDPQSDTWTERASMPTPRQSVNIAAADGKIYAIGGMQWTPGIVYDLERVVEEYDPATDTWLPKASMPRQGLFAAACTVDGKIYVIGGQTGMSGGGGVSSSVLEYDPQTDTWKEKANMPAGRTLSAAVAHDGQIYVFGGAAEYDDPASSSLFVYDPASDTWTERADMPFERWFISVGLVDGKVYLIGGSQSSWPFRPFSPEVWEYDLDAEPSAEGELLYGPGQTRLASTLST
jgi:N-acetylneuraminic acid mutarotase